VGLALAGGGPLGGIYEVGVLLALTDSFEGIDFNDLDVYVGVSSGFVAAALANGISPTPDPAGCSSTTADAALTPGLPAPTLSEFATRGLDPWLIWRASVNSLPIRFATAR
jgi:hypothetical protein